MVLLNICFLRFLKSSSLKSPLVNKCPENVYKCDTELTKQLLVKIFCVYLCMGGGCGAWRRWRLSKVLVAAPSVPGSGAELGCG